VSALLSVPLLELLLDMEFTTSTRHIKPIRATKNEKYAKMSKVMLTNKYLVSGAVMKMIPKKKPI
jgi:hypothetical protein